MDNMDILSSWSLAVLCQVKQRLFIEASSVAVANEVSGLFGPAVQVGYENHDDATWMIVPLGKWLITMVSKSPNLGLFRLEMVYNHLPTVGVRFGEKG